MRKLHVLEMNRLTVSQFRKAEKIPLVVILDNIRSLHNVGSLFRTCDAFRVAKLILCGITATPPATEIHKTALGAEDAIQWEYNPDTLYAATQLLQQGYTLAAVEQCTNSTPLHNFHPTPPLAIILGNEVNGVRQDVIDICQHAIEIPQYGTKHSLNVSVAAGITIYHCAQQLLKL